MQRPILALNLLIACKAPGAAQAIPPIAPDFAVELEADAEAEPPEPKPEPPPRACAPVAGEVDRGSSFVQTRAYIDLLLRRHGAPSVAVAVGHAGEIVWAEGFGFADRARRRRATPDTPYSLASVSKPFTATAIMVLREQGKLKLDAPINDYLGEVGVRAGVGDAAEATIERVANHTAGLPLHYRFFYRGTKVPDYETTRRDFAVLVTEPGERYHYSNLGYGLLEQVIAKVSGQSYAAFMKAEVFTPLGLRNTSVGIPTGAAVRYDRRGKPIPPYGFDHDGASAIYSSAHDLVAFGMTHLGFVRPGAPPLLPPPALARMRQLQPPSETYALGWSVRQVGGHTVISHTGGMPGVRTVLTLVPDYALVFAVLVNGEIGRAHNDVVAAAYIDLGLPVREDAVCRLRADHPMLTRFAGTLSGPRGEVPLVVTLAQDGKVEAAIGDAAPVPVWRVRIGDDGTFHGRTFTDLGAPAAEGKPSDVAFDLQLRGERLTGSVTALVPWSAASTYFADLRRG